MLSNINITKSDWLIAR